MITCVLEDGCSQRCFDGISYYSVARDCLELERWKRHQIEERNQQRLHEPEFGVSVTLHKAAQQASFQEYCAIAKQSCLDTSYILVHESLV